MSWRLLVLAGLFEAVWAIGLEYTDGFTRPLPTAITVATMAISVVLLALAVRDLPVGTAYAVWTGIGVVATAIYGVVVFEESVTPLRIACLGLVLAGVVGLHVTSH